MILIAVTASNSDIHNNVRKGTYYLLTFLSFHEYYNLATDSKPTTTKGKPTPKIKKTNPVEVDGSDDSSSLSSISDDSQGDRLNGSDEEDEEDDEDYDVARMTDKEARRMFDDEVPFFILRFVFGSEDLS